MKTIDHFRPVDTNGITGVLSRISMVFQALPTHCFVAVVELSSHIRVTTSKPSFGTLRVLTLSADEQGVKVDRRDVLMCYIKISVIQDEKQGLNVVDITMMVEVD